MTISRSFCRFCPALCGIQVRHDEGRILSVRGDPEHPISKGYTCPKGRSLGDFHHHPGRLRSPRIVHGRRQVDTSWEECLTDLADILQEVTREVGPSGVALFSATAAAFDANGRRQAVRLLRRIGSRSLYTTASVDTPCRPLVAELVAGHPALAPAIDQADARCTLIIGMNPVVSHGHTSAMPNPRGRLRELASRGPLIVADPQRTETAQMATLHLRPRPGTDHVWLAHVVRELLTEGADWEDLESSATNVDELLAAVEPFDRDVAVAATGIPGEDLDTALSAIRAAGRVSLSAGTGLTMSPTATAAEWMAWALLGVTGSLDRRGGVWFNPGFLRQMDRRAWEPVRTTGPGPASRPELPSRMGEMPCAALADEIEEGNVRVLLVAGGNPLTSLPEVARLRAVLPKLDALAVCDVQETATVRQATHVLPVAGQLERADLPHFVDQFLPVVGSQYTEAVIAPPGDARAMWWVFARLGQLLGHELIDTADGTLGDVLDEDLLRPLAERSRGSFEQLREAGTAVVADEAVHGWVRQRVAPGGRFDLAPSQLVDTLALGAPTIGSELGPGTLLLTPRRQLRQLNSQLAEEGTSDGQHETPAVRLHPDDAARANLSEGQPVVVTSAWGAWSGPLTLTTDVLPGTLSLPHGFDGASNVGELTSGRFGVDPNSGMVTQSGLAVTVSSAPAEAP